MRKAVVFGLVLMALAACEAGTTTATTGSAASGEAIEQAAATATLPN